MTDVITPPRTSREEASTTPPRPTTLPAPPPPPFGHDLLDPSADEMRRVLDAVRDRIVDHLTSLSQQPTAFDESTGPAVAASVRESWPEEPESLDDVLDLVFDRLANASFNTAGPGFLAYIPGGGLFLSAVADLISETLNRYTTVWAAAPGLVQLETNAVRWFADMVGLPETAGGFLSSGGSIANLSALVTARKDRLPEDFLRGTLYVSSQAHHSIDKAAAICGFPAANVRRVEVDREFRLRTDHLEERIAQDRADGFEPFCVIGNAGTTNTGAIDPLPAMAEIAARETLWFHVDAAYGGFFALTDRGRERLAGMEHADSVTLDPHKGLFLPYGTGCLLARDVATLRRAHTAQADYMPPMQDDPEHVDVSIISPELSRGARGMRVWLPMKLVGVEPFRAALDEKLDLAAWLADALETIDGIEMVARPQLSNLAFRLVRPGLDGEELDALNKQLLEAIKARGNVHMNGTRLRGRYVLRVSILSFRTHGDRIEACFEDVRAGVGELAGG